MKAGFYQFTPAFGDKGGNLKKVLSAVKDADLDLLVFPEFFATGYQFVSKDEVAELSERYQRDTQLNSFQNYLVRKAFIL